MSFFSLREEQLCSWRLNRSSEAVRVGKVFPGRRISGFRAMARDTRSSMNPYGFFFSLGLRGRRCKEEGGRLLFRVQRQCASSSMSSAIACVAVPRDAKRKCLSHLHRSF